MNILIIDNGSSYLQSLKQLVEHHQVSVQNYDSVSVDSTSKFDLVILSGGHKFSVRGNEKIFQSEIEIIRNAKVPILGICLGFELIAHAYGGKMERLIAKEKNILEIKQLAIDPIFAGLGSIKVFESHRWIVTNPGEYLIKLASSLDGIEIVKHVSKLIYGFQFHPEMFVDATTGDEIFANFINIVQNKAI